jgi:perosamine synthetase
MSDLPMIPAAKPLIGEEERAAVDRVLASGMVAQGPEVAAFEAEFAEVLVGGRECVAVNSGTSGLHLGLLAAGVGPGDEVIVPSFTFAATANAVALTGAVPVFADIEEDTFNLDPAAVEAAVTGATVGVMPVHLYGHPADLEGLAGVCERAGVLLFEDAAQAHGASYRGAPVGSFGTFAMFSLYPTKNMTSGEGGMVACADEEIARGVRLLRNQGMEAQYRNEVIGLNNRMTDIHAAIGRVQLGRVWGWTAARRANAAWLDANLSGVVVPPVREGCEHVYHQYTVRLSGATAAERDEVVRVLREEHRVGCGVYYPVPNHELVSLARFAPERELPVTARAAAEVFSLPVHPSLTEQDLQRVAAGVAAVTTAGA